MSKPTPVPASKAAGRPKACEVEARMQDLVQTASCLFHKNGYAKVSLEAIARAAHVAVRTIYVKFGGKAGLLKAMMESRRERFLQLQDMETDARPFKEIVDDFARRFLILLVSPESISLQRMVIAEAPTSPEMAETFFEAGPRVTHDLLERFFARPDIRAQLRPDLPFDQLPTLLINSIGGDQLYRLLFPHEEVPLAETMRRLDARMTVFYRAVLREA
jgi:TetR/AcrR family transcriptional repressor of mexJK operon